MELFNKIRRILRGGKALPNEHGPAFIKRDDNGKWVTEKPEPIVPTIDIKIVPATTSGKPDCVCGSGTCKCAENKIAYAKTLAEKQKKATATKPVAKSQEKRIAIQKDIADAPLPKKPVSKKTITEPVAKKAPAKKVTKPVAKEAPKAEPKPAAKKPAPKKK